MKTRRIIEVITDNLIDEQKILSEFPDAFWTTTDGKTRFNIEITIKNEERLKEILKEKEK